MRNPTTDERFLLRGLSMGMKFEAVLPALGRILELDRSGSARKNIHWSTVSALVSLIGLVRGSVAGSISEVPKDRIRLAEWAAVLEHNGRHIEGRAEPTKYVGPVAEVDNRKLLALVLDAEQAEEQSDLVAVATIP